MHNRRALLFFAFAVVFGTAAAFLAHRALEDQTPTTAASATEIETVDVVLARTDPCRDMELLRPRTPKLHYVRFKSDEERRAYEEALARMSES